jgi:hypothetical protein
MVIGESIKCKKSAHIIAEINDEINQWMKYANNVDVNPELRDAIAKTLLNLR